jgi:hypothetical protein
MVASAEAVQSLIHDAQRLADEIESLLGQFQRIDALSAIRRYTALHSVGNPNFEMLNAAKNLRCYAGILSIIARTSPKPETGSVQQTRPRPPNTLPRKRIDHAASPQKRGQQIHRVTVTV